MLVLRDYNSNISSVEQSTKMTRKTMHSCIILMVY